jgi:pyrroloquinoline quinone (PQQ) biosynthesis protein C
MRKHKSPFAAERITPAALTKEVRRHPALDNKFYTMWRITKVTPDQFDVLMTNYFPVVRSFPGILASLLSRMSHVSAAAEYAETLYSELGSGNPAEAHSLLLTQTMGALGKKLGSRWRADTQTVMGSILSSTRNLINGMQDGYGSRELPFAVGMQLGLEFMAYWMLAYLYEGMEVNYASLWPSRADFYRDMNYFYSHIGSTEKEHEKQALAVAMSFFHNPEGRHLLIQGFYNQLNLWAAHWKTLHRTMIAV